nr:MAG TPA: single-stranded-DNA-specific exonuclease RecJ [Caudoviricetes sp.]
MDVHYADEFLDLAALGIIADVMSLKDFETKRIIEKGIANIRNPFIKTMIQRNSFSIGNELTPTGIAFYIAPYVNATIRVGDLDEKMLLFESMLEYKAYQQIPSTKRGCKG